MESGPKVLSEKEIKMQTRKIVNEFVKAKRFSKIDKEILSTFKMFINAAYFTYKDDFFDYLNANMKELKRITANLEEKSKSIIDQILIDSKFYKNYGLVNLYEKIFKKEEELDLYFQQMRSYQHFKFPMKPFERSVFEYHHGLTFVPKEEQEKVKNKDFIDCGGYIGDSALIFEVYYDPRAVFTFEPNLENYDYILETIQLNNLKKVVPVKLGVGSEHNFLNFVQQGSSSYLSEEKGDCKIEVVTIDEFVEEKNLNIGLIKMDIEGLEIDALKGARKTIEKFKPILLLSIYHNAEQFIDVIKFVQDLNLGYKIIIRPLGEPVPILETHLIAW